MTTISGNLTMEALSASLTAKEQEAFQEVTALAADTSEAINVVTLADQPNQLGALSIVGKGTESPGNKLFSSIVYISAKKSSVDVYRLALAQDDSVSSSRVVSAPQETVSPSGQRQDKANRSTSKSKKANPGSR
jgi:hypothetical protein